MQGCSRSTLQRRMREWGLRRREPTLDDAALESLIVELKGSLGLFYGERAMMGLLASRKVWAPRWKVRKILQKVDPEGIQERYACFSHLNPMLQYVYFSDIGGNGQLFGGSILSRSQTPYGILTATTR